MGLQKLIFVEDLIKLGSLGYHFKKKKNALSLCSLPQLPVSIRSRTHALFSRDARVLSGHTLINVVKVTWPWSGRQAFSGLVSLVPPVYTLRLLLEKMPPIRIGRQ